MEIKKQAKVDASVSQIWQMIENPQLFADSAAMDITIESKGEAAYEVKIPIKLGILTLNATADLHFTELNKPDDCKVQFSTSLPGGGVDGTCELKFTPESDKVTIVDITASVGAKGVVQHLLGGDDAKGSKLEGIIDRIVLTAGQAGEELS